MTESDILYQNGDYWVCKSQTGKKGFEVLKDTNTHAEVVATIGYEGDKGLQRAIVECDKLANANK